MGVRMREVQCMSVGYVVGGRTYCELNRIPPPPTTNSVEAPSVMVFGDKACGRLSGLNHDKMSDSYV